MSNSLVALGVQTPQINSIAQFDQSQGNAINAKSAQMAQARQGLEWVGSMALGAMGGKMDGQADPEKWGQGLKMLAGQGVDASVIEALQSRPDLAPVIARASLDTMQQLSIARDERDYELALRKFDLSVSEAAEARAARTAQANAPEYGFMNVNGELVRTDKRGGSVDSMGQFGAQEAGARPLTPEERQQWGIPADDTRPYAIEPGKPPALLGGSGQTINVNNGPGSDGKLRESLDSAEGKQWSDYKTTGTVSSANAQDFQILDELIGMAPQGPITGRLASAFPGVSGAGDAFQSIVKRIAPTLRAPGSGSTSDIEYAGMLQSLPALQNDPSANKMILSIMKAKAEINMQRGEIVTQYQSGEMSAAEARKELNRLDRASVITPEMRQALIGIGGSGEVSSAVPNEGDVVDGYRFKGGNPADANSWVKVN